MNSKRKINRQKSTTAYNRSVYASALKRLGLRKTAVGLRPLCGFLSATVWAGVNASHCPITCPNRRKQPERYVKWGNYLKNKWTTNNA